MQLYGAEGEISLLYAEGFVGYPSEAFEFTFCLVLEFRSATFTEYFLLSGYHIRCRGRKTGRRQ